MPNQTWKLAKIALHIRSIEHGSSVASSGAILWLGFLFIIRIKIRLSLLVVDKVLNKTKSHLFNGKLISSAPFLMFTFLVSVIKLGLGGGEVNGCRIDQTIVVFSSKNHIH